MNNLSLSFGAVISSGLAILFTGLPMIATAQSQIAAQPTWISPASEIGEMIVKPPKPVSLDEIISAMKEGAVESAITTSSFTVGGRTITDFATVFPSDVSSDARSRILDARRTLIKELDKNNFFGAVSLQMPVGSSADTLDIQSISFFGKKQNLSTAASRFTGATANFRSNSAQQSAHASQASRSLPPLSLSSTGNQAIIQAAVAANVPYYTLVPVSGSVTTGLFTAPGVTNPTRGAVNYMHWNSNGFASDQTYEHDFFLNASGGTYFARSFSLPPYCQPRTLYAATSWPSTSYPYLDSNLEASITSPCSSTGNIAYTIGAGQANAIPAGTQHFTAILMPNGDATTDTFLLQGQVGYQSPVGCRSTLCSYPYGYSVKESTHYNLILSGSVPGSQSWTFRGKVPDVPIQISISPALLAIITCPSSSCQKLNFTDVSWDETNIVLEVSSGASVWTFNLGALNAGTTVGYWSVQIGGLTSKKQYCYRLKILNAIGAPPYTSPACATTS